MSSDLERRIADLETAVQRHAERIAAMDDGANSVSRRTLLHGLGVLGLGSTAIGTASADPQGRLGRASDPLRIVYTERLAGGLTDGTAIASLLGPGLEIDEDTLRAVVTGATNTGDGTTYGLFTENDDGTLKFRSLSAGSNVSIDEQSDELVLTADDDSGGQWNDSDGDGLLEPDAGYDGLDLSGVSNPKVVTSWVGTTDATAAEIYVNDTLAGRLATEGTDLNSNTAAGNVLLGQYSQVKDGAVGVSVLGGGSPVNSNENKAFDDYAVIGGGSGNQAGTSNSDRSDAIFATVGGGFDNTADGQDATIGGGGENHASAYRATVAGGGNNAANATGAAIGGGEDHNVYDEHCTVAGGLNNQAGNDDGDATTKKFAMVPGGQNNTAKGQASFAAGKNANADHNGVFAWCDGTTNSVSSAAADQFVVRAGGGLYFGDDGGPSGDFYANNKLINTSSGAYLSTGGTWTDSSSRAVKEDIDPVDGPDILDRVDSLPVSEWSYEDEPDGVRHIGPMAEDFYEAFGLGADDEHIAALDSAGVALAAIKGLLDRVEEQRAELSAKDDRIDDLEDRAERREQRVDDLERDLEKKAARIDDLEARLEAKEERIDRLEEQRETRDRRIDRLEERLSAIEQAVDRPADE